jgi:UDP-N-acetylmuramate--alanine ligase
MSALALVCRSWGADVAGSDRARTPYVDRLEAAGIPVAIGHAAGNVPDGAEVIASSAVPPDNPELAGRAVVPRGALLAELVALGPAIVVAGAHGKTTTTAMVAYCLDRLGLDPTFLVGGDVPQLGGNGRAGTGLLVAEGDESDRSLLALRPRVAVVTNVDLDHHATFASRAEVEELFARWLASLPAGAAVIRGEELEPYEGALALPGAHNRRNAACALAALAAVGVDGAAAARALADFRGAGRRLEAVGEAAGVRVFDDYAHHPAELAATLAAMRELAGAGRVLALFQPHLYSRTQHVGAELGQALAAADVACVTDVYAAREDPLPGVTGKLVVDGACAARPGMTIGYVHDPAAGAALVAGLARPGDVAATIGAGDVGAAAPLLLEALRGGRP